MIINIKKRLQMEVKGETMKNFMEVSKEEDND
jgi:hypothetical protein